MEIETNGLMIKPVAIKPVTIKPVAIKLKALVHRALGGSIVSAVMCATLCATMCATAAGAPLTAEPTPLTLRLSWTPFAFHTALFLAVDRGWMKDAGIDLTIEDGTGSTASVTYVGAGRYDLGEAAVATMAVGRENGLPLKAIAGFIRGTDLGVFVPKGSGIKTPRDLEGKRVIYTAGSLEAPFMLPFLKAGGVDPSKVQLVNTDASAKISTYLAGNGDAMVTSVPNYLPIISSKRPSDTIMFGDYGFSVPGNGYIATEKTIQSKSVALRAFVQVMSRAWHEVLENGQLGEAIAAEIKLRPQSTLDANDLRAQVEAYRPLFYSKNTTGKPLGWESPDDWSATVKSLQAAGLIAAGRNPADFYTNEFFPR